MPTPCDRLSRAEATSIEAIRNFPEPFSDQLGFVSEEVNEPLNVMPSGKLMRDTAPEPDSVTCSGLATTPPEKFRTPHESSWSEPFS